MMTVIDMRRAILYRAFQRGKDAITFATHAESMTANYDQAWQAGYDVARGKYSQGQAMIYVDALISAGAYADIDARAQQPIGREITR